MSASTREWLLDKLLKLLKLLKMRISLTEQKLSYEQRLAKAIEERDNALRMRDSAVEDMKAWAARVAEMAPEKQFSVIYRGASGAGMPLAILAVSSCHGKTTITVARCDA